MITETIIPWVLGTLLTLTLLMLIGSIKSWRDMKRSPYFFLRRQAEKRLQTYSSTSMVFLLITVAFVGYAWRAPAESIYRVAVLTNAKPPEEEIVKLLEDRPERIVSLDEESIAAAIIASEEAPPLQLAVNSEAPEALTLPSEFDQFEPTAELLATTELGEIDFSTEINDDYEAVNPGLIFPEGFYTLYATFSYDDMADGMEWAWVWRHNGEVIEGGNELWAYGEDGPGYIYFNPEEGFQSGKYSLEVWVNGDLLTTSTAVMNSSAAAASN